MPDPTSEEYQPLLGLMDRIFPGRRRRREAEAQDRHADADDRYAHRARRHKEREERLLGQFDQDMARWNEARIAHDEEPAARNALVDAQRALYERGDPDAIVSYCELVLSRSECPDVVHQDFAVADDRPDRTVAVDVVLTLQEELPSLVDARYVAAKDAIEARHLKDKERQALYETVIHRIRLRTIHELVEADTVDAIDNVVVNGWAIFLDRATGHAARSCLISVKADKRSFLAIKLDKVEPKACFRSFKGVGSPNLRDRIAIAPVLQLNKEDQRFVAGRDVLGQADEATNLAAIG